MRLMPSVTKRTLIYGIGYIFYLLFIVLLVDFFSSVYFLHKIWPTDFKVSDEKMSKLESLVGWIQKDKKSSFSNFYYRKREGVIRIGCFGDSFTHGDEVNDQYDYPSLLQEVFSKNGYDNVEVLNFGAGGYGFHQTYMMWESANINYAIDFVLLNPPFFLNERDSTFNNRFNFSKDIYNLHSRYILKNKNEIERVDVIGESMAQRIKNYWTFIPSLRYLRFDSYPPLFLSAPVSCVFPDKWLNGNPFYYKKNLIKEMAAIYKILLTRMSQGSSQVILGTYDRHILDLAKGVGRGNFFTAFFYYPQGFPYIAFAYHNSPLGNKVVALQMFDCLTNKPESNLTLIETTDIDRPFMQSVPLKKIPLSSFKNISFEIDHVPVGRFYDASIKNSHMYCQGPSCIPEVDTFSGTASLLLIKNDDISMLDYSMFLPLDFEITDGLPIVMRIQTMNQQKDHLLGHVRLLNPGLNIGALDFLSYAHNTIWIKKDSPLLTEGGPFHPGDTVTILIKGTAILRGKIPKNKDENIMLELIHPRYFVIRADGRELIDTDTLANEGTVYLSLERGQQDTVKIPFGRWHKVNQRIPLGNNRLHFIPPVNTKE
jgi:hypothetical protein